MAVPVNSSMRRWGSWFLCVITDLDAVCYFDFNLYNVNEISFQFIFSCVQCTNDNGSLWSTILYLIHSEQIKVLLHSINLWVQNWLCIAKATEYILNYTKQINKTGSDSKLLKGGHVFMYDQNTSQLCVVWMLWELRPYSSLHSSQFSFWAGHAARA